MHRFTEDTFKTKVEPVNGINSIKRTENALSFVISMKSNTSDSLRPLITTTLSFTELKDDDSAVSKERRTASWPIRRVIISNLKGSRVSKLVRSTINQHKHQIGARKVIPYVQMSKAVGDQLW